MGCGPLKGAPGESSGMGSSWLSGNSLAGCWRLDRDVFGGPGLGYTSQGSVNACFCCLLFGLLLYPYPLHPFHPLHLCFSCRATGLPEKYCTEAERKANIQPDTSVD